MTKLLKFFLNEVPDNNGRYLDDMLQEDFYWMEDTHDFVQWWFPNTIPSNYSKNAPLLTEQDIREITDSVDAKIAFMQCVDKMTRFFGFEFKDGEVIKSIGFDARKDVLCGEFNHNHMRFTRVLLAMYYFGFKESAKKMLDAVSKEATEKTSIAFWQAAVKV